MEREAVSALSGKLGFHKRLKQSPEALLKNEILHLHFSKSFEEL